MSAIKCKTEDCDLMTWALSMFDTLRGYHIKTREPIYDRTTKWKCDAGHISETQSVYEPKPRLVSGVPLSVKRFHAKGFRGHRGQHMFTKKQLKDSTLPKWRQSLGLDWKQPSPLHDPNQTNHQRVATQTERRKQKKLDRVMT